MVANGAGAVALVVVVVVEVGAVGAELLFFAFRSTAVVRCLGDVVSPSETALVEALLRLGLALGEGWEWKLLVLTGGWRWPSSDLHISAELSTLPSCICSSGASWDC
jgi:hypothetical protein